MRITCNRCLGRAVIRSSRVMSADVRQLYCVCLNPECGHSFVMDLAFSHTLSPSALDFPDAVRDAIRQKGRGAMLSLFAGLG